MFFLYKKYKKERENMIKMTIFRLAIVVGGSFFGGNMVYYFRIERRRPLLIKKKTRDKEVCYDESRNFKIRNLKAA